MSEIMANNTSNNSNVRNGVNNDSNNKNAAAAAATRGEGSVGRSATIASSPTSSGNTITAATATSAPPSKTSKAAAQMQKMRDANNKYKNLLKMAKERIEQQEIDLKKMRETRLDEETTASKDSGSDNYNNNNSNYLDDAANNDDLNYWNLVRVSQRIRVDLEAHELNARGSNEEIWALIEWERDDTDRDMIDNNGQQQQQQQSSSNNNNRKKLWKRFDSESELKDFIRRDTGEPLTLPPYSLTPQQSSRTTVEADKKVSSITEEYRRFRVKSEMTRKKMDAQVRELQSSNVETTKRQIEGREHVEQEMEATRRTEHNQLERMRTDAARQEDQWKEAYDILLKENDALKCSGSDAILASQWRQRYEACLKEKDDAVHKLQSVQKRDQSHQLQQSSASFSSPPNVRGGGSKNGGGGGGGSSSSERKYEMKYRDLKESFRLYRKKAKEIFVSQAAAAATSNIIGGTKTAADMMMLQMSNQNSNAEEDSKLSYLKNLMVNYLTADPEVRDHMEKAIGTVLKFTPSDIAIIEKKKTDDASWGLF